MLHKTLAWLVVGTLGFAQTASAQDAAECGRQCLIDFVDLYLDALSAHDPGHAPFSGTARYTENAQVLALGDGLWNTVSGGPGYKLVVADPATRQAGFYILMEESSNPIWLSGRLRVEDFMIIELETVIVRSGSGFGNFEREAPDPLWNEALDESQRRPRDEMVEIADRYFTALADNLADYVPFHDDRNRIENGVKTANNPDSQPFAGGPNVGAMSCRDNINSMMWHYITEIDPRRYLVVDEERGIVFGIFMFHHDGTYETIEIPGFGEYTYSGATRRPFTTVIPEMFKIVDGRIRLIEATMTALPFGSTSRWDD
jgi:hypothetical protein